MSKKIKIYVIHISAHARDTSDTTLFNNITDRLAKGLDVDESIIITDKTKSIHMTMTIKEDGDGKPYIEQLPKLIIKKQKMVNM